jgi:peptide/nickel transport system substrate-binding protein
MLKNRLAQLLALLLLVSLVLTACGPAPTPEVVEKVVKETVVVKEEVEVEVTKVVEVEKEVVVTATPVPPTPPPYKPLVLVIGAEPAQLDPQARDSGNERAINDQIYENLLYRDRDMNIVPGLAESLPEVADETTWRVKLRQGVQFHNGEPFNAEAAAYSINRLIDEEYNSELRAFSGPIIEAKAVDEYTLDIMTDGPDPILPSRLAAFMKMVPPKYFEENPDKLVENPVGTGPYKFVEWVRGDHVTLVANEDYWDGAPETKDVVIRFIAEDATRLAALQAGEADFVRDLLPEFIPLAPKVTNTGGIEFPIIRINTHKGVLADKRVRQALNYAVDKEAMVEALFGNYATVYEGQICGPGIFGYNPDVKAYPYDPDKARELLKEAGADGASLEIVGERGRWLKDAEIAETVAGYLRDVGLDITLTMLEFGKWFELLLIQPPENQPDLQFSSNSQELLDADRALRSYYSNKWNKAGNYFNPDMEELIIAQGRELDRAKREAIIHEALAFGHEEAVIIFLINLDFIYGLSERLEWQAQRDGRFYVKDMVVK